MRIKSLAALGTLSLIVSASAFGQQRLNADVPFEFTVANRVMPAGHYEITSTPTLVVVRGFPSGAAAVSLANGIRGGSDSNGESRLVFNKYGEKYFLAEVWSLPETGPGAALLESKAERRIAHTSGEIVARVTIPMRTGAVTIAALR